MTLSLRFLGLFLFFACVLHPKQNLNAESSPSFQNQHLTESYGLLPLTFEANQGQTDHEVKFLSRGQGYALFLTQNEAVLSLNRSASREADVVRLQLIGANSDPIVEGIETQPGVSNYLFGNDPSKWRTNVPHVGKVKYRQVYDGIDLVYYGNQRRLEYDYIVAPCVDPSQIRMRFAGAKGAYLDENGNLILQTATGEVVQQAPISYQEMDGKRQTVPSRYIIHQGLNDVQVSFKIGTYDTTKELIIDPILSYSTYLGGSKYEEGLGITIDQTGNVYMTGYTSSSDFPLQNAMQNSHGGSSTDVFVTKLSATGSSLTYATYLGGNQEDIGNDIVVDQSGNAYITGSTSSPNFPVQNAFQNSHGGGDDVFVAKLDASGASLSYATYLGGSGSEKGSGIVVDQSGNAYTTGQTASSNFPVQNALQSSRPGSVGAFVAKLNAAGSSLIFSTYLGGNNGWDRGFGIAIDQTENIYIAGDTESSDFPTQNAYQNALSGTADAFVAKLDASGGSLTYATYFGGSNIDRGFGLAVDQTGNAYITGETSSSDLPTQNAFQNSFAGNTDAFVAKLDASGGSLTYASYLGGSGGDYGNCIVTGQSGNAYITGRTTSTNFPTQSALQNSISGNADAFVVKIDASGGSLTYASYLGGSGNDTGHDIVVDSAENMYISGDTGSSNFPTQNAFQNTQIGNDSFVAKISPLSLSTTALVLNNTAINATSQQIVTLSNNSSTTLNVTGITLSGTNASAYSVSPTSFSTSSGQSQDITVTFAPTSSGTNTASLSIANDISGNPISVSLSGQGTAPTISLSTTSLAFGTVSVDASSQQTVTISNTGDATLNVTGISLSGTDASAFSVSPTSFSVAAGQNQSITLTFTPNSSGSKSASLSIAHNASGSPSTVSLTGQGTAPSVSLSTSSVDFGTVSVDASSQQTVTISNTGDATLNVTGISLSGTDASAFSVSPTSFSVAAGQNQSVTLTFTPNSSGSKSASLSIAHNASGSPSTVSLTGQGIEPVISLSATSLAFGTVLVDSSSQQTVTVSNTGTDTLIVTNITFSDANTFSATPTSFTVSPNQNQTITVTASPSSFNTFSGNLTIAHNASGNPSSVSLTVTSTAPNIGLSANSLNFGDVDINTEKTLTLVVSNTGNVDLAVSNITLSNSAFTVSPTSFTVNANNNQGVGVTFRPTSSGDQSATLIITSNDPDQASLTITLTGKGTEPPPPPPPPQNPSFNPSTQAVSFGNVRAGQTHNQTLTISNTGNATLTVSNISVTGTAFTISSTSFEVPQGQSQSITITFSPSGGNEETGSLSLVHNASGSPTVVALTGTGVFQPDIRVTTTDLDFAQILVGSTHTLDVWIINNGNADLQINSLTFTNPRFETTASTLTIAGGDSQSVGITFRPAVAGLNTGSLTISHNAQTDPIEINLSGEGILPPSGLQITPATLNFDRVDINDQLAKSLQIENPGTDTVSIISLQTNRLEFQTVQDIPIPIVLAPNASQTLDMLFSPRRSGIISGELTLTTQDTTLNVFLQGEGVVAQPAHIPNLEITPSEIVFDQLSETHSDTVSLTLSNANGTGVLFVDAIQFDDPLITATADSFLLKPGQQKDILIIAQPAQRTFPTGQIQILSSDPNQPTTTIIWRAGILLQDLVLIDLDSQPNNQNQVRMSGIATGDSVTIQFFAQDFPPITGYGLFVDYNTDLMNYQSHTLNPNFIQGATEQIRASKGRIDIGLISFTGVEGTGSDLLGDITFTLTDAFTDSTALDFNTITLSLPNGGLQELPQRTKVWLIKGVSPDFTGDGQVDFRDFLLFGQAFGSTNPNFDLDGDGTVGFPDFIIFATAFSGG